MCAFFSKMGQKSHTLIRGTEVYEYLWNDDVRPKLSTIFKVDEKLILYLKSNCCACGKVWFTSSCLLGGEDSRRRKLQYRDLRAIPWVTLTRM